MNRRTALAALATIPALSGCVAGGIGESGSGDSLPTVVDTDVTVVESRCTDADEAQHEASIAYDSDTDVATVDGVIALHDVCFDLFVDTRKGVGKLERPDSFKIDIDYLGPTDESEPCDCPGEATYEATVAFDRPPASIDVFHIEKQESGVYREGPFARIELD